MNTCSHEMLVVMGGQKSNVSCVNIVNIALLILYRICSNSVAPKVFFFDC